MFRTVRVTLLLFALLVIGVGSWQTTRRIAAWDVPLHAVVHPIAGDDHAATARYLATLTSATFAPIERFVGEEAGRYDVRPPFGQPLRIRLGARVDERPPAPPIGGSVAEIMWWSLPLRWWAWRVAGGDEPTPDVTIFVVYHDPAGADALEHSLGLEKGRIGVVNAFASEAMVGSNNVVVAHELLHTVGASDKYDPETRLPRFPDGYADPDASPRHPQRFAEIMAGGIPLSDGEARVPPSLNATLIGTATAREIGWGG
ncbi:MAG: hypothetical protein FJ148_14105 [Deltaproteobacteria bacterium]|nr:hypothetical protein [Deltaproteobacteria bacterium]